MHVDWRQIIGPILTTTVAASAVAVDSSALAFSTIAPLLVFSVGLAGTLGGSGAGFVSAAIATGIAVLSLPDAPMRLIELTSLAIATGATAAITGRLRGQMIEVSGWQHQRHAVAERLSAALDRIDIGVVLLDPDTRAEFINRAFRDYFALPDDKAETKPPFIALMYHARDAGAFKLPDDELAYDIAERTELMRSGDPRPLHLTLADGRVLRVSCAALPDGSRMMSYAPLNDALRRGDDPRQRDQYYAMRSLARHPRETSTIEK